MRKIMIDCKQEIPCDPCRDSCAVGAIRVNRLTDLPAAVPEKCVGCGNCVAACPGQACYLIDDAYSESEASVDFAFEFLPVPVPGEERQARDNAGNAVCSGRVVAVMEKPAWHGTRIVRLAVPKESMNQVRGMDRLPTGGACIEL